MSSPVASPTEKSDQPKRKRGWRRLLQFRLRTVLLLTAVVAIWLGWWLHSGRQQREAVAELRKAGALIYYDFQSQGHDRPLYWPVWLVNWLGVDCFADVGTVSFTAARVTDADLAQVNGFTSLQDLHLGGTQVTDAGLEHLKELTSLQLLWLEDMQVTDAGLEHVKGLTSLQSLFLKDTHVTDVGLEHLKNLTSLQGLYLEDTEVTDAGLEHLKDLTSLQELFLYNTQVTDAGVAELQKSLPNCDIDH